MTKRKTKNASWIEKISEKILSRPRMALITSLLIGVALALASIHLTYASGVEETSATQPEPAVEGKAMGLLSAALAIGISSLGAGIAIYGATSAGAAAIAERPELSVWIIVFAGLGEGLAIYGLVVAIMILGML